ncbi:type II toxin-antitoxin system RatA family toxin [Candidatus Synchoanobacter obligatus]|uniref:Type II toxin-antitoxin system RatA family toxin n=1 Tax=Candidatus Synchoanobacter obligatus TaxID=2919597 RepID=A0ABT1L4H2_9GAMM|nr:type II toxin-antitoxin system RatA family toxin [Candidatus Synchoanobacter obligatus]MCP8352074.1 type II toxin-antitoxin system RatA family toxin [Candidatus Synchoanobacter obligatus]
MKKLSKQVYSKHTVELLYEAVNDTEAYRLFIPFCTKSEVLQEGSEKKLCRLTFSQGFISRDLITVNTLWPNHRIDIVLKKGDFSHLYGQWLFQESEEGSLVSLDIEYAFNDMFVAYTFGKIFDFVAGDMVNIFCRRADELSVR